MEVVFWRDEEWALMVREAVSTTINATRLWAKVARPVAVYIGVSAYDNPEISLTAVALVGLWVLQRLVRRYIGPRVRSVVARLRLRTLALRNWIQTRSRIAALILPHALFATLATALYRSAPIVAANAGLLPRAIPFIALGLPAVRSIQLLSEPNARASQLAARLGYWTILGALLLVSHVPFLLSLLARLPAADYTAFCLTLWLVIPWLGAVPLLQGVLSRLVSRHMARVPRSAADVQRQLAVLDIFVTLRLISAESKVRLADVLRDGFALAGLPFLLMPGMLTYYGILLVGVAYPVYATLSVINGERLVTFPKWLAYWVLFALGATVYARVPLLAALPLAHHMLLVALMALQLPYFDGALRAVAAIRLFMRTSIASTLVAQPPLANNAAGDSSGVDPVPASPPPPDGPDHDSGDGPNDDGNTGASSLHEHAD